MKNILVTGGAGFIGSHLVEFFSKNYPEYNIIIFDKMTYAASLENINNCLQRDNCKLVVGDIARLDDVKLVFEHENITDVIHLAAESHVDNSIENPLLFVETNVIGTCNLLNVAKEAWKDDYRIHRFHHVSTDEVYGSLSYLDKDGFKETDKYDPHSPYSASKASSDLMVLAYAKTYGMNVTISNCSNNYGPHQYKEKLIPMVVWKLMNNEKIPVYGNGKNMRDWLWVGDHVKAIDKIFHYGRNGETYNVGADNCISNIQIIGLILDLFNFENRLNSTDIGYKGTDELEFVVDRKGHDFKYEIDFSKLNHELGWMPEKRFKEGMRETIRYYMKKFKQ